MVADPAQLTTQEKTSTGIEGFDKISLGGVPKHRTTLVGGTAGSGKTMFALQFLVNGVVRDNENGVLVTFEESPEDLIRNVKSLGWDIQKHVDEEKIAIVDASPLPGDNTIASGNYDLSALIARIEYAVEKVGAQRVILDSIGALFPQIIDAQVVRNELHRLVFGLRKLSVTSLVTIERGSEDGPVARYNVEEFVADNVVMLRNRQESERRRRTIEIIKMRGSAHFTGEYPFSIDSKHGVTLSPLATMKLDHDSENYRISSGIAALDDMCEGGFFRDSVVLVSGATGTGKTLMVTQFMQAGIDSGERSLLFAFEESNSQLTRNAASWGIDFAGAQKSGVLKVVAATPESNSLIEHLINMKQIIEEFKPTRIGIDSLSALERMSTTRSFREFVIGFTNHAKSISAASLLTCTTEKLMGGDSITDAHISTITDSVIALRYVEVRGEMRRGITVLKMRGSFHDNKIREYIIDGNGMEIRDAFTNVIGIFSGTGTQALIDDRDTLTRMFSDDSPPG